MLETAAAWPHIVAVETVGKHQQAVAADWRSTAVEIVAELNISAARDATAAKPVAALASAANRRAVVCQ